MASFFHMGDNDFRKGAFEEEKYHGKSQNSMAGQLPHRTQDEMLKSSDTDFPEPDAKPEHTGEPEEKVDQDPGERQKRNQPGKGDPLAA